jgi:myo-inositol-1(or 4)-monophosphatase
MNDRPIRASKVERMENSLIAVGFSYDESARSRQWLDRIAHYQANSDGVRRLGSSTADAVYVACGRFDAFVQSGLSAWDVAAASLIAQRAGACVSDFAGGDDYIFGRQFVATNPLIYKEIIDTLND